MMANQSRLRALLGCALHSGGRHKNDAPAPCTPAPSPRPRAAARLRARGRPGARAFPRRPLRPRDEGGLRRRRRPRGLTWLDEAQLHWPKHGPEDEADGAPRGRCPTAAPRAPLFSADALEAALARSRRQHDRGAQARARQEARAGRRGRAPSCWKRAATCTVRPRHRPPRRLTTRRGRRGGGRPSAPTARRVAFVREHDLYVVEVATRARARLTSDGDARRPERQAGLGLPGGDLRPRRTSSALLVEPRLARARLPAARRDAACPTSRRRRHPVPARASRSRATRRPAIRTRRSRLGVVARRRRRRRVGRPRRSTRGERAADRRRGLDARRGAGRLPGAGPRADLARPRRSPTPTTRRAADAASARRRRPGSSRTAARRWLEGRLVPVAQRAHGWKHLYHYRADGTLIRPVTSGEWEVRTLHGVDEAARLGLLLRHRAQPHRRRRLPRSGSTAAALAAAVAARRARTRASFNPSLRALRRHLERRRHAAAGAPAPRRRRARCA